MKYEDEREFGLGHGEPYRLLKDIERPFSEPMTLELCGEAIVVNRNLVLAYKFIKPRPDFFARNTMFVAKEKTIPLKIEKDGSEVAIPDPEMAGQFGVLFVSLTHPVNFFVGEDYKISFRGRRESDRANRIVRFMLKSRTPIIEEVINGNTDYSAVLRQYYLRRPRTARE